MLSFHKHNKLTTIHEIVHDDWENILDQIYFKIVRQYLNIFGIASNTVKKDENDKIGTYSEETIFRFHKNIDKIKHNNLSKINKDKFNNIYKSYSDIESDNRHDFYHIKGEIYEIEEDILIYPLYHSIDKKALILLMYDTPKEILDEVCNKLLILHQTI